MKRYILLMIAVIILLIASCALAEETEIIKNGIVYTLNGDGTATVTGYTEDASNMISIPETVEGNTVIAIGDGAFANNWEVYSISFPATVTSIGEGVFEECYVSYIDTGLTEEEATALVEQLDSNVYVGFAAEAGSDYKMSVAKGWADEGEETPYYYGLVKYLGNGTNITLPEQKNGRIINEIGPEFAKGNETIQNLVIPGSYWGCGVSAFEDCTALKTVNMRYFDTPFHANRMFAGCTALEEVIMNTPWEGGPCLGNYMFDGCTSLKKVTFPYAMMEWEDEYYPCSWAEWGNYTFRNCVNLETIELDTAMPVHNLGSGTFQNCEKLSYLACYQNMQVWYYEEDGDVSPFDGCSSITLGVFRGSPMEAFAAENGIPVEYLDEDNNDTFYYTTDTLMEESYITGLKTDMEGVVSIPDTIGGYTVVGLSNYLFKDQEAITEIRLPDTINSIGIGCFSGCTGLTSIRLPAALEYINEYVFENCTALTEVYLPDNMWWIDETAFEGCGEFTLYVNEGSDTQTMCDENGIGYTLIVPGEITVDFEKANLRLGDVFRVYVHRENISAPMGSDEFSCVSSDEEVVSVDTENNVLTAVGEGEAILTFTALDEEETSVNCAIVIGQPVMVFPQDIGSVEAEAFADDESLFILDFTGTEFVSIERDAFAGCANLTTAYFVSGDNHDIEEGALPEGVICVYEGEENEYMPISLVTE